MGSAYGFLDLAEFFELCAQGDIVGVPGKAAGVGSVSCDRRIAQTGCLPNEKLGHDESKV